MTQVLHAQGVNQGLTVKAFRGDRALVLGHGAGGGVAAPDLVAVADVAHSAGLSTALVEQPYRVAGRRSPAPAAQCHALSPVDRF